MDYIEYKISLAAGSSEDDRDILMAELGEIGFDSFDDNNAEILCYVNTTEREAFSDEIDAYVASVVASGGAVEVNEIETVNWNKEWESNFDPIFVDDLCCIRAPFHEPSSCKHDIVIMPKMSFGTGHHATTHLMTRTIFSQDYTGLRGLDMGSGTGILAIAALINGAEHMDCIDIDEWAFENCAENCESNGFGDRATSLLGDASLLDGSRRYDFILANINRNILVRDMPIYTAALASGGTLQLSGFLEIDIDDISECAEKLGYEHVSTSTKEGWVVMLLKH